MRWSFFSKDAHEFACETVVHLSTGISVQAKAKETEIYAAFDSANEKMEKQFAPIQAQVERSSPGSAEPS